ncbi:MAG: hypothetical protein VX265_00910 [Myxococcota bacterium]|nr:hypothetical protein [Myxococcota bacterium]MEC8425802.1 hypothetical protein [Myxococcota bacterium]
MLAVDAFLLLENRPHRYDLTAPAAPALSKERLLMLPDRQLHVASVTPIGWPVYRTVTVRR